MAVGVFATPFAVGVFGCLLGRPAVVGVSGAVDPSAAGESGTQRLGALGVLWDARIASKTTSCRAHKVSASRQSPSTTPTTAAVLWRLHFHIRGACRLANVFFPLRFRAHHTAFTHLVDRLTSLPSSTFITDPEAPFFLFLPPADRNDEKM